MVDNPNQDDPTSTTVNEETQPQPQTQPIEAVASPFADAVCQRLGEYQQIPVRQIQLLVQHMGEEFVQQVLDETFKIEEHGGMMTADGLRRRTPGGTFFYLAKSRLDPQVRGMIFPNYGKHDKGAVLEWVDRIPYLEKLAGTDTPGWLENAPRIILRGRPRIWEEHHNTVIFWFNYEHKVSSYPHGVTHPPTDIATPYAVIVAKKQWDRVYNHIRKNNRDFLIVEGTCVFDAPTGAIVVFSMLVTCDSLDKKNRTALGRGMPAYLSGDYDESMLVLPPRPSPLPSITSRLRRLQYLPPRSERPRPSFKRGQGRPEEQPQKSNKPQQQGQGKGGKPQPQGQGKPQPQAQGKGGKPQQQGQAQGQGKGGKPQPQGQGGQRPQTSQPYGGKGGKPQQPQMQSSQPKESPFPPRPEPVRLPVPPAMQEVGDNAAKLLQLREAANTLRERIAMMEARNMPGIAMTRRLLDNTLKQISDLERGE
jgi:hypothetical protein